MRLLGRRDKSMERGDYKTVDLVLDVCLDEVMPERALQQLQPELMAKIDKRVRLETVRDHELRFDGVRTVPLHEASAACTQLYKQGKRLSARG
jgi:hypothetical protein